MQGQIPTVNTPEYRGVVQRDPQVPEGTIWDITGKATTSTWCSNTPAGRRSGIDLYCCKRGGMVVICAGTTGYNLTLRWRYMWIKERFAGSRANRNRRHPTNNLMVERRLDPTCQKVFSWVDIRPPAWNAQNQQNPSNMAVLVQKHHLARAAHIRQYTGFPARLILVRRRSTTSTAHQGERLFITLPPCALAARQSLWLPPPHRSEFQSSRLSRRFQACYGGSLGIVNSQAETLILGQK
jgi:hypothetical protein